MSRPIIILLSGYIGSGKDTAANVFKQYNFKHISFAEELKNDISKKYNFDYNLTQTQKGKDTIVFNNKTVRDLLIEHGNGKRNFDENYWVKILANKINDQNYVISDFRFPNECFFLKQKFNDALIITIRINRFSRSKIYDVSEYALDNFAFDYTVNNHFHLQDFMFSIKKIIWKLPLKKCILDVDDTILNWSSPFSHFLKIHKKEFTPNSIIEFNKSEYFKNLKPLDYINNCSSFINLLKSNFDVVIILTNCGRLIPIVEYRITNLNKVFGKNAFNDIFFNDFNYDKSQFIKHFPIENTTFIDQTDKSTLKKINDLGYNAITLHQYLQ